MMLCRQCMVERACTRADDLRDAILALADAAEDADPSDLLRIISEARSLAASWSMEACPHQAPLSAADAAVARSMEMYG